MSSSADAPPGVQNEWFPVTTLASLPEGELVAASVAVGDRVERADATRSVTLLRVDEDEIFALPGRCGLCRADLAASEALCDWLVDGGPCCPPELPGPDAPRAVKIAAYG